MEEEQKDTEPEIDLEQQVANQDRGLIGEFWEFLSENKKWWLAPIIIVLILIGMLVVLGGSGAAPFIYTLF